MRLRPTITSQNIRNATSLSLLVFAIPVSAETSSTWNVLETESPSVRVTLRSPSESQVDPNARSFVITHGMYGTEIGDRFHALAEVVTRLEPQANVVLVDWSSAARTRSPFLQIITPNIVARQIDSVAADAATLLDELGIDVELTTLIGESFGNWVNAGIAKRIGRVDRILAMNPANELAGYRPPCLRDHARVSWSFHTYSLCDTLQPISHVTIFLETPSTFDMFAQHTSGICRLTAWLIDGNDRWLNESVITFTNLPGTFHALATMDGNLVPTDLPRKRPVPEQLENSHQVVLNVDRQGQTPSNLFAQIDSSK